MNTQIRRRIQEPRRPRPWYRPLVGLESKGSATTCVGGLAGLAAARAEHQGQFFTPLALVELLWQVTGLFAGSSDRELTILDNSFGSGRMFAFANRHHKLFGIETDRALAEKVQAAAEAGGLVRHLAIGSLDEFRVSNGKFDVGLINPPFSLHIDTPYVEPAPCNAYGQYGPKSSALSHVFALWQALQWCHHVAAVLPSSSGAALLGDDPAWGGLRERLVGIYKLPRSAFLGEGANVETVVAVFGPDPTTEAPRVTTVPSLANVGNLRPLFDLDNGTRWQRWQDWNVALNHVTTDAQKPAITTPYTGDPTVRVVHDGRKIGLRFACGHTEARVLNAVYRVAANGWRHMSRGIKRAEGIKWVGQGWFDMENYLAQPNPMAAFGLARRRDGAPSLLGTIRAAGGQPEVDPGLLRVLARKVRRRELERTPFRHVAYIPGDDLSHWFAKQTEIHGTCREAMVVSNAGYGKTRTVDVGDVATFVRSGTFDRDDHHGRAGPRWTSTLAQCYGSYTEAEIARHFEFDCGERLGGWAVVHEGLATAFPRQVQATQARARALGLEKWCSWAYQFEDLVEVATKRRAIIGWEMGLGKARLALALCMLGGAHNLITVEAHLVNEMVAELAKLEVPEAHWQVITTPRQARDLRRINIITYSRLKARVRGGDDGGDVDESDGDGDEGDARARRGEGKGSKGITFADFLRRRVHTHVCDEGHVVRHPSQQTRAVLKVSAKCRYLMSGTPIANYARDMLPLVRWVGGDGTAVQIYGKHRPYMQRENLRSVDNAARGTDVFRNQFVTTVWASHEFEDGLSKGAKREVAEIADVAGFRAFVAPWVKRRVLEEPDVARHIHIPRPRVKTTVLEWDRRHLALYCKVSRDFVEWFKALYASQKKGAHLAVVLAKMEVVHRAANFPAFGVRGEAEFPHVTSKQRHAIRRLRDWTAEGHKSILLCQSPDTVDWFAGQLAQHGIEGVRFHGKLTIRQRIQALDERFRYGDAPVLLATKGTLQTGYNIHQASRVFVYDRTWTPKTEHQACARVLRPQQTREVQIEFAHLPGSIDEYQAQMVAAKAAATKAGLDYGSDERSAEGFLHLETILSRFVADFQSRFGITTDELIAEFFDKGGKIR